MGIYTIISLIALVVTLLLGITYFVSSSRQLVEKLILSSVILIVIIELSLFMIFLKNEQTETIFWAKIASSSFCLLLPTCTVISHIYARKNYIELLKKQIYYLSLIFGIGFIFLFLVWKFDLFVSIYNYPQYLLVVTKEGKHFLIFALLFNVLILINLESTLRSLKVTARKTRRAPIYLIFGLFLFGIYVISQMLMFSRISKQLVGIGLIIGIVTFISLLLFSFKSGLSKHEVQIGREAVYSSITIFIVGIYLLIIGLIGKIVQVTEGEVNLFISFLAALIIFCLLLATLVSRSLKQRIKTFIDTNFYKNRYDYREQWGKFSDSLATVVGVEDILNTIIENITHIFKTEKAAILLQDDLTEAFIVIKNKNMPDGRNIRFSHNSKFIDWFYRLGKAVEVSDIINQADSIGLNADELTSIEELSLKIYVPMIIQKKLIGILALGEKEISRGYTIEDYELLETLANQSSVAILNAKLNEELVVSREMESFNKLSSFILHDLKNSIFMLSMVIKNAKENWDNQKFQNDMLSTISTAISRMTSLVSKLSSLPEKLEPKRQLAQINDVIKKVINNIQIADNKNIKLESNFQELPLISIDSDLFQKVVENLIINAIEALPNGGNLSVSTKIHNQDTNGSLNKNREMSFAEVEISDSGLGMSEEFIQKQLFKPFQTTKKKGLGIGLFQCKEIVTAIGGKIEVISQENIGTKFKILLPILNGYHSTEETQGLRLNSQLALN